MVIVITLNYNQNEYTIKCLESILKSENVNYHVILVDNGSSIEKVKELENNLPKSKHLSFIKLKDNIGYVGGINLALEQGAKLMPDYFLIMNNDTIIDKKAISELLNTCLIFNNKAIVSGKVYHYNETDVFQDIGSNFADKNTLKINRIGLNEKDVGQYENIIERDMLDDIFWLFPFKLYEKIGGYSPYFWFNAEQADFALRAKKENFKLIYTPKAKLWHKGSVSIGGRSRNPRLVYWHIQSSLILRYLHLSKSNFLLYFFSSIKSVFFTSVKSLFYVVRGDKSWRKYAYAKRKGLLYFVKWVFVKNENTGNSPF